MNDEFIVFQSFTDPSLASTIADRLKEGTIPFQVEDTSSPIDPLIIGSDLNSDLRIKLRPADFEKGWAVLDAYYEPLLASVEPEYYLLEFTNSELEQIIEKPYEWGRFDYLLAQKLLKERGRELPLNALEEFKDRNLREMSRTERVSSSWIWLGYFLAVFFSPVGLFYGGVLASFKKTLPNGQKIYTYDIDGRRHGRIILVLSACLSVVWILTRLFIPAN